MKKEVPIWEKTNLTLEEDILSRNGLVRLFALIHNSRKNKPSASTEAGTLG